jgi:GWxTD domain-containing protein
MITGAACGGARLPALDPESRIFFDTARLVMTDIERDIFLRLPDAASRREFIADFWDKRDPDSDTEANEFKEEFERRIEYVDTHFREGKRGINTDRGRIYLYLGPPEHFESFNMIGGGTTSALWWVYYSHRLGIEFVDTRGSGEFTINEIDGDLFQAMERAKLGAGVQRGGAKLTFVDFDVRYDKDRREIVVAVPLKKLNFKDENGLLQVAFAFTFFLYQGSAEKETFGESRTFSGKAEEIENQKEIAFVFPRDLPPGRTYVDVIVDGGQDNGRIRKIIPVKS